jgi:hypothetical protein
MTAMRMLLRLVYALPLALLPLLVQAHTSGSAFVHIARLDDTRWRVNWDADLRDLQAALELDGDHDGALTWREVQAQQGRIATHLRAMGVLSAGGKICDAVQAHLPGMAEHGEGDLLRLSMNLRCAPGPLTFDAAAAVTADPSLRMLLTVEDAPGQSRVIALSAQSPRWQQDDSRLRTAARFVVEGMHHLFTGYDHLAFLAVLLFGLVATPSRRTEVGARPLWKPVLGIVTAFTAAHSLTLTLAATGVVRLPSALVESTIAVSIIVAALLNLLPFARRYGWQLALGFGFIHGFGFAGALAAMTSRVDLLALAAFNIGIELAQLVCAAALLPLLWWADTLLHPKGRSPA